jgi:hypothetical protein
MVALLMVAAAPNYPWHKVVWFAPAATTLERIAFGGLGLSSHTLPFVATAKVKI